jgi:catechol 2,3-dioxygenase-like lactoylglutathione lyase family enzyme
VPAISRVLETALYCDNLDTTARFYQELLGLTPLVANERIVALDAGQGTVLLLFQRHATLDPVVTARGTVPVHDGSGPVHFALAVSAEDLPVWETRLTAAGIGIDGRVTWERGGRSIYFRDPENHSVELATPGTWAIY